MPRPRRTINPSLCLTEPWLPDGSPAVLPATPAAVLLPPGMPPFPALLGLLPHYPGFMPPRRSLPRHAPGTIGAADPIRRRHSAGLGCNTEPTEPHFGPPGAAPAGSLLMPVRRSGAKAATAMTIQWALRRLVLPSDASAPLMARFGADDGDQVASAPVSMTAARADFECL